MEEIAKSGVRPASIRFMDNLQFQFGYSLRIEEGGIFKKMMDAIKSFYVLRIKGF
jgi:alkyldihydroxyacetonephosphate synthase